MSAAELTGALSGSQWVWQRRPFPHIIVDDLFTEAVYATLVEYVRARLGRGATKGSKHFGDPTSKYFDAEIYAFDDHDAENLPVFLTREWHNLLADLLGIEHSGEIDAGIHRHAVGSVSGWVHNDLNPGYFSEAATSDTVVLADRKRTDYQNGRKVAAEAGSVARIRAAAMLFYLDNDDPAGGGQTGLYDHPGQPVASPTIAVAPLNNRMLAFRCTPHSYHSFMTNRTAPRTSIILWLHQTVERATTLWGEASVVRWGP